MAISIQIKSFILAIIFKFFDKDSTTVILFGSHARGDSNNFSDIDIGINSLIDFDSDSAISKIRAELKESNIPYNVDVVNLDRAQKGFLDVTMKKHEIWHQPS